MRLITRASMVVLTLSMTFVLSACESRSKGGVETITRTYSDGKTATSSSYIAAPNAQRAFDQLAKNSAMPVDQARALVSGQTSVSYDFGMNFGNQIEYNAPDGINYLWFPGNKVILKAKWDIRTKKDKRTGKDVTAMCYQYGSDTYNPATQTSGGNWECQSFGKFMHSSVDRKAGDVFGISSAEAVPHILERRAIQDYVPNSLPVDIPYITNGKSPIDHLLEDFAKRSK